MVFVLHPKDQFLTARRAENLFTLRLFQICPIFKDAHAKDYDSLLRDLIIHPGVPSYEKALSKFLPLAGDLIARMGPDEKLEENQKNKGRLKFR